VFLITKRNLIIIIIKYRTAAKRYRTITKGAIIKETIIKKTIIKRVIVKGITARKTIIGGVYQIVAKWAITEKITKKEACRAVIKGLIILRSIIKTAGLFKLVFRYKTVFGGIILIIIFVEFIVNLLIV